MDNGLKDQVVTALGNWNQGIELMEKLFSVAQPGGVFSEPVTAGEQTVITASEVVVGMGFGYGAGAGTGHEETEEGEEPEIAESEAAEMDDSEGFGGGGGGGGGSFGRPVAAISIGPDGVRVEPVVDVTKIALAFFTTLGAMFLMLGRMRKAAKG